MNPPNDLPIECPLCHQAFAVAAAWLGQPAECPHCCGAVQLPTEAELATSAERAKESPPPQPTATAPSRTEAKRPVRSRTERVAARKKRNLLLAIVGGLLLATVFVVLANL